VASSSPGRIPRLRYLGIRIRETVQGFLGRALTPILETKNLVLHRCHFPE
jgi:hypothetical protein